MPKQYIWEKSAYCVSFCGISKNWGCACAEKHRFILSATSAIFSLIVWALAATAVSGLSSNSAVLKNTHWMRYDWTTPWHVDKAVHGTDADPVYILTRPDVSFTSDTPTQPRREDFPSREDSPLLGYAYANLNGINLYNLDGDSLTNGKRWARYVDVTCQYLHKAVEPRCPVEFLEFPLSWADMPDALLSQGSSCTCDDDDCGICGCKNSAVGLQATVCIILFAATMALTGVMGRAKASSDSPYRKCPSFFQFSLPVMLNIGSLLTYASYCKGEVPDAANAQFGVGFYCLLFGLLMMLPSFFINLTIPVPPNTSNEAEGSEAAPNAVAPEPPIQAEMAQNGQTEIEVKSASS